MNRMYYFGEKWDAPITDDALPMATPTDQTCMFCRERFVEGDDGVRFQSGYFGHKECNLRGVMGGIGHLVNHGRYCASHGLGPDAGLSYRESAKLVWQMIVDRHEVTEEALDALAKP